MGDDSSPQPAAQQTILDIVRGFNQGDWDKLYNIALGSDEKQIQAAKEFEQKYDPTSAAQRTASNQYILDELNRSVDPRLAQMEDQAYDFLGQLKDVKPDANPILDKLEQASLMDMANPYAIGPQQQAALVRGIVGKGGVTGGGTSPAVALQDLGSAAEEIKNQRVSNAGKTQQLKSQTALQGEQTAAAKSGRISQSASDLLNAGLQDRTRRQAAVSVGLSKSLPTVGLGSSDLMSILGNEAAARNATNAANYAWEQNNYQQNRNAIGSMPIVGPMYNAFSTIF